MGKKWRRFAIVMWAWEKIEKPNGLVVGLCDRRVSLFYRLNLLLLVETFTVQIGLN